MRAERMSGKPMSDPMTNAEVEDVLSSIRRLVSENKPPKSEEVEETKKEITKVVSGWYEKQNQKREGNDDGLDWEEIANRCSNVKCTIFHM